MAKHPSPPWVVSKKSSCAMFKAVMIFLQLPGEPSEPAYVLVASLYPPWEEHTSLHERFSLPKYQQYPPASVPLQVDAGASVTSSGGFSAGGA
ncbi:MAG: hypothetical protein L6Q49_09525 [Anaerolineales bacterium]|nr:hypothetical protein [Anaerolineales bacterium]